MTRFAFIFFLAPRCLFKSEIYANVISITVTESYSLAVLRLSLIDEDFLHPFGVSLTIKFNTHTGRFL